MKPFKPVFLKTYGKQMRKLSAWISSQDRKQVFDSTSSTDDLSVFEPEKPKRTRVAFTGVRREERRAKKKARLHLTEKGCDEEDMDDEENIIVLSTSSPPHAQKTSRRKRTSVCSGRPVRPGKRKTTLCPIEVSKNEDNIMRPSSSPSKKRRTTRTNQLVSAPVVTRQRGQTYSESNDSGEEICAPERPKMMNADSNVHELSAGRFVTRRTCAASNKLSKAISSILSSSDDFTSGAFGSSRIHQPSRRRKVPPLFGVSSADSSGNTTGTSGFTTNPFREISLNESADHSLGPCSRKPIFCSTPSAGSFRNRRQVNLFPTHNQVAPSPSLSVSCIGVLSAFQDDLGPPRQPAFPPQSASVCKLPSEEEVQQEAGLHQYDEQSVDLFMEPRSVGCSEEAKMQSGDSDIKDGGELPSVNLLSADSEISSHFLSATGGLDWLIEALKQKCLSQRCTVQMSRLNCLTVTQLSSQTAYSSCLEDSSSVHSQQPKEQPQYANSSQTVNYVHSLEESYNHQSSVENNKTSDCLKSVNDFDQSASETYKHRANNSPSADYEKSNDWTSRSHKDIERSESVIYVNTTQHTHNRCEIIMVQEAKAEINKKCFVQLQKLAPSLKDKQLSKSKNTNSPVAKAKHFDPERTAVPKLMLKEKCVKNKPVVQVKRLTLSQLRKSLHLKCATVKSSTDVSDSSSNEETNSGHLSVSDCSKHTASMKSGTQNVGSATAEGKTASCREPNKNSHKRKNISLAPKGKKRRSTSADRPGTTRKACVSGMSVSRWKNKGAGSTHGFGSWTGRTKAVDCSITELVSGQHNQSQEPLAATMNFSTPVRGGHLNLTSLLADFTPSTHTWSRLKAALSVHRRGMVQLTPRSLRVSVPGSPQRMGLSDLSQDLFATPWRIQLSRRLQSQLLPSQVECDDLPDAEKVYAECGQQHPLPWEECILPDRMKRCSKIGEGTFGEVFSTNNASGDTVALKIIPVEGSEKVNGEDQKTFGEILHEIIISKELSSLKDKQHNQTHGFIGLNDLHCVQGCYPPEFLKAWDTFDKRKCSENDRPDFFGKNQLFIILEFEFGGIDLENSNGTLASLGVAKSILHQATAALAVAEQELHFEHRDLHWGNVLVKTTRQRTERFFINGTPHCMETKGVLVRIIDYSLSRLEIDDLTVSCDISNDEELFMGQGDYQFDIYRLMRQENGNNWNNYHPHTNVLWLHYLCSKLLSMKYRKLGGRDTKDIRQQLTCFYDNILQYGSAMEALRNCPMLQ